MIPDVPRADMGPPARGYPGGKSPKARLERRAIAPPTLSDVCHRKDPAKWGWPPKRECRDAWSAAVKAFFRIQKPAAIEQRKHEVAARISKQGFIAVQPVEDLRQCLPRLRVFRDDRAHGCHLHDAIHPARRHALQRTICECAFRASSGMREMRRSPKLNMCIASYYCRTI